MKILCRFPEAAEDSEYRPDPFTEESVDDIVEEVWKKLRQRFEKKFKGLNIDMDDIRYTDNTMKVHIDIYNGNHLKLSGEFEFTPYSNYWDASDYEQHKNITIQKFVDSL